MLPGFPEIFEAGCAIPYEGGGIELSIFRKSRLFAKVHPYIGAGTEPAREEYP